MRGYATHFSGFRTPSQQNWLQNLLDDPTPTGEKYGRFGGGGFHVFCRPSVQSGADNSDIESCIKVINEIRARTPLKVIPGFKVDLWLMENEIFDIKYRHGSGFQPSIYQRYADAVDIIYPYIDPEFPYISLDIEYVWDTDGRDDIYGFNSRYQTHGEYKLGTEHILTDVTTIRCERDFYLGTQDEHGIRIVANNPGPTGERIVFNVRNPGVSGAISVNVTGTFEPHIVVNLAHNGTTTTSTVADIATALSGSAAAMSYITPYVLDVGNVTASTLDGEEYHLWWNYNVIDLMKAMNPFLKKLRDRNIQAVTQPGEWRNVSFNFLQLACSGRPVLQDESEYQLPITYITDTGTYVSRINRAKRKLDAEMINGFDYWQGLYDFGFTKQCSGMINDLIADNHQDVWYFVLTNSVPDSNINPGTNYGQVELLSQRFFNRIYPYSLYNYISSSSQLSTSGGTMPVYIGVTEMMRMGYLNDTGNVPINNINNQFVGYIKNIGTIEGSGEAVLSSRAPVLEADAIRSGMFRFISDTSNSDMMYIGPNSRTNFNFMHQTGVFTIMGQFVFSGHNLTDYIMGTSTDNWANNKIGFSMLKESTNNRLTFYTVSATGRLAYAVANSIFTGVNQRCCLGVRCSGVGATPEIFCFDPTTGTLSTVPNRTTSGVPFAAATGDAFRRLVLGTLWQNAGSAAAGSNSLDGLVDDVVIYNKYLTDAQLLSLAYVDGRVIHVH